jgi:hypothetical protein
MTNEDLVQRSTQWSRGPVNAACRFACQGPAWLPRWVRVVPLRILALVVEAQVLWLAR